MRTKKRLRKINHRIDDIFSHCKEEGWTYDRLNDELLLLWAEEGLLELEHMHCSVNTGMGE